MAKAGRLPKGEHKRRINKCVSLLANGQYKHQIVAYFKEKHGVSHYTVGRYLQCARAILLNEVNEDKISMRGKSLKFYKEILADPQADKDLKMRAQQRIDKLCGLEEPTIVHQHIEGERKLTVEYKDDWQKRRFSVDAESSKN